MTTVLASALCVPFMALQLLLASPAPNPVDNPTKPASFEASVYVNKAHKIRLAIDKAAPESMMINLRPVGQSTVVFTKYVGRKVSKAVFILDVDQLADGAYELELKTTNGQIMKYIDLKTPVEVLVPQRQLTIQ